MSDELNALQETAVQARAKADELNTALTDASSDEERAAAADANNVATAAESAFADAKAKADADAAAQGDGATDTTSTTDNTSVPVDGSRTGFVEKGQAGGACICPDGRKGTIHSFDAGLVCIPNEDQSA